MSGRDAQVIIAGAGPVGTFAAYFLAQSGIDVIVLESAPNCMEDMRASTFHPPTLEMLDDLGIADELILRGLFGEHRFGLGIRLHAPGLFGNGLLRRAPRVASIPRWRLFGRGRLRPKTARESEKGDNETG